MKQTAAISALFILVNSISGLIGFASKGGSLPEASLPLIGIVFVGGVVGLFWKLKNEYESIEICFSCGFGNCYF